MQDRHGPAPRPVVSDGGDIGAAAAVGTSTLTGRDVCTTAWSHLGVGLDDHRQAPRSEYDRAVESDGPLDTEEDVAELGRSEQEFCELDRAGGNPKVIIASL